MNFYYEEYGGGKPVILLHAFPLNRTMWREHINALTAQGCRVLLPDLKGFGENNTFSRVNGMDEMALEIADLMDYLKIDKAVIGGLSMGGYVTFDLYRLFPEKFSAVMLFDTNSAGDSPEKSLSRFELIKKIEIEGLQALVENMLPNLVSVVTKREKPELVKKLEAIFHGADQKAIIATLRGLAERPDHSSLLPEISVPTLLIFGAEDKVTNLETARNLYSQIQNSQLHIIPQAGHYSNLEEPATFNAALVGFIKNIEI